MIFLLTNTKAEARRNGLIRGMVLADKTGHVDNAHVRGRTTRRAT